MLPGRLGVRFALEALFLILLAIGAGLADLRPSLILLVMAVAWVLVAVIEFTAERIAASPVSYRLPPRGEAPPAGRRAAGGVRSRLVADGRGADRRSSARETCGAAA